MTDHADTIRDDEEAGSSSPSEPRRAAVTHHADTIRQRENRIRANHALLQTFQALWDEMPDQRFGQLVKNLSREDGGFADIWEWKHGEWYDRITAMFWKGRKS